MTPPIRNIVFDLGGVLIDWNPRYLYRKLFTDEKKMESFLADVCHGRWNEEQDAGRPFTEAIDTLLPQHPSLAHEIRAYFERWEEMLKGPIQGTVDILEALKRSGKVRLFALSNWSAETFPIAFKKFSFLATFEKILLSGEEKLVKPDPRFYRLLTTRYGLEPSQSLFIDDMQRNIDAAAAIGFQTIHFVSPEQLATELRDRFAIQIG